MTAPAALSLCTGRQSDFGAPIPKIRVGPGCRQAGDRELLLDGHRQSKQRPTLAAHERGISIVSRGACSVAVAHNDGVDLWIKRLDTRNRVVDKLAGGDLSRARACSSSPAVRYASAIWSSLVAAPDGRARFAAGLGLVSMMASRLYLPLS